MGLTTVNHVDYVDKAQLRLSIEQYDCTRNLHNSQKRVTLYAMDDLFNFFCTELATVIIL